MRRLLTLALLAGSAWPAVAQETAASPPTDQAEPIQGEEEFAEDEAEEIVVTGQRVRGAVIGDIPPETTLNRREIQALGAGSIAELLEALEPQTRSGRGRDGGGPVVLLNGNRISGFSEIRGLPPEAISRVDILPEEVALKYGYRAEQRVVNIVLRQRFRAITAEVEHGFATDGGRGTFELDANLLRIIRDGRVSFDVEYERESPLLESQRNILAGGDEGSLTGTVAAPDGGEIDPALSALAGVSVTSVAVPPVGSALTLGDFLDGPADTDSSELGRFRTLLGESDQLSFNAVINRALSEDISGTINGRFEASETESLLGLPSASLLVPAGNPFSPFSGEVIVERLVDTYRPLTRSGQNQTGQIGVAVNGSLSGWRWSFTGNFDRTGSETRTDRGFDLTDATARAAAGDPAFNPFAPLQDLLPLPRDTTQSTRQSLNGELVANGSLLALPAGEVSATFRLGAATLGIESETERAGVFSEVSLGRSRFNGQANVDIPIADRGADILAGLGDLSANFNAEVEQLSDFGALFTLGAGINWEPIDRVRLIASITEEDGAPSIQQLGDPTLTTPNVRVFDFIRGETIEITRITGGNPDLLADSRSALKIGLNIEPLEETDLRVSAEYNRNRTRDLIASFPTATAEIEAAFPERFVRDPAGRLLSIDSRPVNFAEASNDQLRWGINFSKSLGPEPVRSEGGRGFRRRAREAAAAAPEPAAGAPAGQAAAQPQAQGETAPPQQGAEAQTRENAQRLAGFFGGRGGRGGGRFGFGGQPGPGRVQLSLYHTWRLHDQVLIRDGLPPLDFLGGAAAGSLGGRPEHEIEFQANLFKDGFGGRLSVEWQAGTYVSGVPSAPSSPSSDLFFADRATIDLRLFANLGQQQGLVRAAPFFRGARVSLVVDNLFNSRPRVTDASGVTPISFQPDLIEPLGRSVRISFRKLFF